VTLAERQARLAKVYDGEILPTYAVRFATPVLRAIDFRPAIRAVEIGCATGYLTRALARRLDRDSDLTALDEASAFVAEARAKIEADTATHAPVALLARAGLPLSLPLDDGAADLIVSNLAIAGSPDPRAAVQEAARALARGGQLVLSAPLRGTWAEFFDLFRDVLREGRKLSRLAAVDRHIGALPDGGVIASWLESAGLVAVELVVERWEILFRSAREFFFAPLVELGPLSGWKELSGSGDEMQDAFFFTKEAIDAYFKGRAFPITVIAGIVKGWKQLF
jgi:SAM-dependent methyltransferase